MTEDRRRSADPQLSDISLAIGSLQAGEEHAVRSREILYRQVEAINQTIAPLPRVIEDLAASLRAMQPHIASCDEAKRVAEDARKAVEKMEPKVDALRLAGARQAGMAAVAATVFSVVAGWIMKH